MIKTTSVKAPGKILWIGGYSVLERPNASFVSVVDVYVGATLETNEDLSVQLNAPQLNMSVKGYLDVETGKIIAEVPKEMLLLKTSAEVAARYAIGLGVKLSGFTITTNSDAPFAYSLSTGKVVKSGLGSSAAVTVAAVGSILKAFELDMAKKDALHKLSQTAHSIATGKVGSGFDIAAASFGSIFYTRYSPEILREFPAEYTCQQLVDLVKKNWDYKVEKFSLPPEFKLLFANFGESMITTHGIGGVSEFKMNDPDAYNKVLSVINDENAKAIEALRKIKNGDTNALQTFKDAFENGRLFTKRLGALSNVEIEPDDCSQLIEDSNKNGAFVSKLPGAGGKDAIAALSLTAEDQDKLKSFWGTKKELNLSKLNLVDGGVI